MARLVVNPDSADAWEIQLGPGTISLGRSASNDFRIEHSSVSSSHCQIEISGVGAKIKDLGSTNGTFVEGQLVEEARLRPGQVFRLGDVQLRFEVELAEGSVPPRLPAARPAPIGARPVVQGEPETRFGTRVGRAFLYPLAKDGVALLVTGTVFLSVIDAMKYFARYAATRGIGLGSAISLAFLFLFTAVGVGYLTSYLRRVVTGTAMGDQDAPDWPDLTDLVTDILSPFFQLCVTVLASLGPAILVGVAIQGTEKWGQVAIIVAGGVGGIYFPMAFLAVAMFDSVAAVNPLLVVPSILKVGGSYVIVVALLGVVLAVKWYGAYYLPKVIPLPVLPSVISTLVGLYLLMVEARVLGLLYLVNKEQLGWFSHR